MTLITKITQVRLKFLLSLISVILCFNFGYGENDILNGSKRLIPALEVSISLTSLDVPMAVIFMEDTVCTSIVQDTFYVNTIPNVDTYSWTIPSGANITSTIGDTMIIVDWTNAIAGLADICIETINNCGTSSPTCFPIRILVCNEMPNAIDDARTTPSNTPILVDVQTNDTDLDNDLLTTGLDNSNPPSNGMVSIINNDIEYTPDLNFTGVDEFQYYICDNGNPMFCDTATVTITVENGAPVANPDVVSTIAASPITIPVQDNDTDPENHDLTTSLNLVNNPTQGTVSINGTDIIYTPTPTATGSDEFGYIICDNGTPIKCDTTIVTINLENQAPIAVDDRDTTLSNQAIIVEVQNNDTDPESNDLITSLAPLNPPANGTLIIIGDNIQYTPTTDFTGNDSFDYIICDNGTPSLCDTASVDIVVLNQKPIAANDLTSTQSGMPVTILVQDNDSDPEDGVLTTTLDNTNGPTNGTVTVNGNDLIYTPGNGFSGTDSFDYIICDDGTPILCDTATVTISTENQAPIAVPDTYVTPFEIALTLDVQVNDSDPENGLLVTTINPSFPPANGTVSILNGDSILYTPATDFIGTDQFGYIICDDGTPILCDTTIVTVTVPNDPPVAVDDSNNTVEDVPVNGTILGNDFDPNRNDLILNQILINSPSNGTINLNPDGSYTYTSTANYNGLDAFTYQICDGQIPNLCDTAEVTIIIAAINDAPLALDDANSTDEDTPVNGTVLPNDTDVENDNLTVSTTPVDTPENGIITLNPDGNYTYMPDPGFNGTDSFQYEICDDGIPSACDTATVTINIGAVNDPPIAMDDVVTTDEDMPVSSSVLPNDNDPDGDDLTVSTTPIDNPDNGVVTINPNGSFTYTPVLDFNGIDEFQYEVCDDGIPSLCDTATVTITINPVNDPPVAIDDSGVTDEDTPVSGSLLPNDTDLDGDDLVVNTTSIDEPDNGTVTLNPDGTFTYIPDPDFNGMDEFQYEVCDDGIPSLCDIATVAITINPVNDAPIAVDDPVITDEDTPISGSLLPNDTDPEGDNLVVDTTPVDEPDNGALTLNPDGTYTYTPDPGFNGTDSFQYEVCDDGIPSLCDTATVNISVNPTNDAPLAVDDNYLTTEDTPLMDTVLPNDSDPDNNNIILTTTPVEEPNNGILTLNPDGTFTYLPEPAFNGQDTFLYELCDTGTPKLCDTAQVIIVIDPANDPPVAVDDIVVTPINEPAGGSLLTNDFDPEGDDIVVITTPIDAPDNGILVINPDGTYTYTPDPNFVGEDSFDYQICDDGIPTLCDTATVVIYIIEDNAGINDPPVAINDNFVTNTNQAIINVNLLTNDFDPDGNSLILNTAPINPPSNGTVFISPNGNATYTPATDYNGQDVFTYRICDNGVPVLCDTATVSIVIIPSAQLENSTYANDDAGLTYQDVPLTGILNDNDNDPEGDNQFLLTTPITPPSNGIVTLNTGGTFEYIPNPSYVGADLFVYQVCDDGNPVACDLATVYLTVLVQNTPPYAIDDVNVIPKNGMADGDLLANDFDLEEDNITVNIVPIDNVDNGIVTINPDGTYTYTPNTDFVGEDIFTYQICDDGIPILCDTATVTIEIIENNLAVNDPPVGVNDVFITLVDTKINSNLISNDFDPDGDVITINTTPTSQPENGMVTINADGTFQYMPAANFRGDDSFNYQICDDQNPSLCTEVVVSVTIIPITDMNFTFANDDVANTTEDNPVSGNLLVNDTDPEGDSQNVIPNPTVEPENGMVLLNLDGTYTYTPNPDYFGGDQFTYTVCDNGTPSACDEAVVRINIQPENDPPNAKNDINITLINTPVSGFVLTNDEDPEGDDFVINTTPLQAPENGAVLININGTYDYTPTTDFSGEDLFSYIICENQNPTYCDTAIVFISIIDTSNPENNPPVSLDDANFGIVNLPLSGNLIANDSDPDGDPFNITTTPISQPINGTVIINPNGTYTYTPNPDFIGADVFEYEICDLATPSACDTAKVTIEIFPNTGNTVFANDDAATGNEDSPLQGDLLVNDFDPEGNNLVLNISPTRLPQHGTVTLNTDGSFSYFPVQDYNGSDQFDYEVCDDNTPPACDIATVYLTVLPVSDTLCAEALPKPTLLSNGAVCFTEEIHLFIQENYPLFTIENTDLDFSFTWFNGLGDTIATTTEPNFTIAADHPMALSPFTVKVRLDDCSSDFADPVSVDIAQLPTIIATSTSGSQGVCVNGSTQLMATSITDATYTWRIVGDTTIIATTQNPIINNIGTTTTFEVQVKPALCEVFSTATITIMVNEGPSISPQLATGALVCLGSSFQVESNATGIAPFVYQWTGPNNFSSNAANPVISNASLDNSGSYTVEVTDANACVNRADLTVDAISAGPEQPITNSNSPVCIDGMITINLQTPYTGSVITYNWINGQGNTVSTDRNLNLAANNPMAISPYFLQVTIDGCQSPNSESIVIDVQDIPTALVTSTTTTICAGGDIQLLANEVGAATYEWRLLDDPTILSTLQNPTFRNIQQDTAYTLTVRSGVCPDRYAIDTIAISISPRADFAPSRIYTLNEDCSVSELQLNANLIGSTAGLSFQWTGPNSFNSSEQNPVIPNITDAFNGAYALTVTNGSDCATTKTIFINDLQGNLPKPVITALNTGCTSDNIILEAPIYEGNNLVYTWLRNNLSIGSNSHQLFIDNALVGVRYQVVIQVDDCIIESNSFQPLVFDQPTVVIEDNLPTLCTDGTADITLNASIAGGQAPYEIVWSSTTGFQSFSEDATIVNATEALSGTYSIEIVDQNGCIAKASTEVDIKEAPAQPIINFTNPVCEGTITTLSASNFEGVNVDYSWQVPNQDSISGYQGAYILSVEIDGCVSSSDPVNLEVIQLPTIQPTATYTTTVDCAPSNLSLSANISPNTSALTFLWTGPNGFNSNAENPIIVNATPANNGQYFLKITNNAGCALSAPTNVIENIRDGISQPIIQGMTTLCEGATIQLTAPVYMGNEVVYFWFFNNELIADASNFELVIPQANATTHQGNYHVLVDVDGCQRASTPVAINLLPIPTFNPQAIFSRTENCTGSNLVLNANLVGSNEGLTFEWAGPNGYSSNAENPVIVNATTANNGQYTLLVTNGSNCSQHIATNIIDDIGPILPQPLIQTSEAVCEGGLMTLTAPLYTGAIVNYNWLLNGDRIEGENTNEITIGPLVDNEDTYQLEVQVDDCTLSSEVIQPNVLPMGTIDPSYELSAVCEGGTLQLSANRSNAIGSVTYLWTGPNGYTSNAENPFIGNINEDFNGTYTLVLTTLTGCETSNSLIITEIINEPAQPTVITNGPVCVNELISLSIQETASSELATYVWFNGNNEVIGSERSISIAATDPLAISPYSAQITVGDCGTASTFGQQ